ncbi:MAG TPA: TolC family protein, partial [Cytophagaceae bacterium]
MKQLLFLLFFSITVTVNGQDTLSLEQAMDLSLKNNFSAQIARNNQLLAEKNNNIINAGFLPELNLGYNDTRGITDSRVNLSTGQTREGNNVNT